MAIGKIEEKQEELAEKEVNTTMGVNFLIIILGSDSPPLARHGGQAQRNSIRDAATRYQNKSSIKSAGAALRLMYSQCCCCGCYYCCCRCCCCHW